jgi:hypothetical protein
VLLYNNVEKQRVFFFFFLSINVHRLGLKNFTIFNDFRGEKYPNFFQRNSSVIFVSSIFPEKKCQVTFLVTQTCAQNRHASLETVTAKNSIFIKPLAYWLKGTHWNRELAGTRNI